MSSRQTDSSKYLYVNVRVELKIKGIDLCIAFLEIMSICVLLSIMFDPADKCGIIIR